MDIFGAACALYLVIGAFFALVARLSNDKADWEAIIVIVFTWLPMLIFERKDPGTWT